MTVILIFKKWCFVKCRKFLSLVQKEHWSMNASRSLSCMKINCWRIEWGFMVNASLIKKFYICMNQFLNTWKHIPTVWLSRLPLSSLCPIKARDGLLFQKKYQVKNQWNCQQSQSYYHLHNHAMCALLYQVFMAITRKHCWQTFLGINSLNLTGNLWTILLVYCLHVRRKCILEFVIE